MKRGDTRVAARGRLDDAGVDLSTPLAAGALAAGALAAGAVVPAASSRGSPTGAAAASRRVALAAAAVLGAPAARVRFIGTAVGAHPGILLVGNGKLVGVLVDLVLVGADVLGADLRGETILLRL